MTTTETLFARETLKAALALHSDDFASALPGSCMKLTGLPLGELKALRAEIMRDYPALRVVILTDGSFTCDGAVTATKLIEMRNGAEAPLLALVPSALQTPAEDSYGSATFRELPMDRIADEIIGRLEREMPATVRSFAVTAFDFVPDAPSADRAKYLLALRDAGWGGTATGLNLNVLGLISDTSVVGDIAAWRMRLYWNRICSEVLCDFQSFVPDRVARLPIRPDTNQREIARFLMACADRTRHGMMDALRESPDFAALDFAAWNIPELEGATGGIRAIKISAGSLGSPQLKTKDGDKSLVLKDGQTATVKVRLTCSPSPKDCPELKVLRLMLVSTDSEEEVQEVRRVAVKPSTKAYRDLSFKVAASSFEEGTYFIRAYGEDDAGNILNFEDDFRDAAVQDAWIAERRRDPDAVHAAFKSRTGAKTANETEDFDLRFVTANDEGADHEGDDDAGKKDRKARLDAAYQGYIRCRIGMMKRGEAKVFPELDVEASGWGESGGDGLQKTYNVSFAGRESFRIGLPAKLCALEREFLRNGDTFGCVNCMTRRNPNHAVFDKIEFQPFNHASFAELVETRKRLFALVGGSDGNGEGLFETWLDFCKPENLELVKRYVSGWRKAIEGAQAEIRATGGGDAVAKLVALQTLDTIRVESPMEGGRTCVVRLMPPIHPLRLAWFVNLVELFGEWEAETLRDKSRMKDWTAKTAELFLGGLCPSSNPTVIAGTQTRYGRYAGEIAFGWGIWTRPSGGDAESSLSDERQVKTHIAEHLNLAIGARTDSDLSVEMIVRHFRNYLKQHPYADSLVVNVFNPGDGAAFVKALLELETTERESRRYEFRLFCDGGRFASGTAFRALTNPESQISGEAEVFSEAAANRLFPKLRFSVNPISDFLSDPYACTANISFLVSPFTPDVRLVRPDEERPSDSLNGLVVKSVASFSAEGGDFVWSKCVRCREADRSGRRFFHEANVLLNRWQAATAAVMNPDAKGVVPGTAVTVGAGGKSLVSQIHNCSDWVVTFDRSIGPEMFDARNACDDAPYLLDYVPGGEYSGVASYLTARPGVEAYRFLEPYLDKAGLESLKERGNLLRMLEDVRAISGSLLMQALATDNKAFEVIGLALTKRMLEKKGYLRDAFIVPVDLHRELFGEKEGESRERADLLLVGIDAERRKIRMDVVEVKCRSSLQGEAVELLETKVKSQIDHTIEVLRENFEIADGGAGGDRIDRAAKNIELRSLLEFYVERANRFGMMDDSARKRCLDFCMSLDEGYALKFNPLEIIYNFAAPHGHCKEQEDGVTRYKIGKQLIGEIMDTESDLDTIRLEETLRAVRVDTIAATARGTTRPPVGGARSPSAPNLDAQDVLLPTVSYDTLVGAKEPSPQYGLLGIQRANGRKIAIDLSGTSTISLFGVQGAGKSYTIGTITEMALKAIRGVNELSAPLSGVIFHYSRSPDYAPEFTSMNKPNPNEADIRTLLEKYGARPDAIDDIVLLAPKAKVEERRHEYPGIEVRPIAFKASELGARDWQFLMGTSGNQSMYVRQLNAIMKDKRDNLSLQAIRDGVDASGFLSVTQKGLARQRLEFAQEYIDDSEALGEVLKPGRLVVVDLRDEFIEEEQALGLFVVMMNIFSGVTEVDGRRFNKFIVFDEAHKYMGNRDLTESIVTAIREMRHKGVSLLIASQDPPSLPIEIIELSSIVLMHKFNSPAWLGHIRKAVTQLAGLLPTEMATLAPGEAFLWANKSTDWHIEAKPVKIIFRPRATMHGGATLTAI